MKYNCNISVTFLRFMLSFTFLELYVIINTLGVIIMIKLVASDLDGTIIDKNNYIYENNLKAINDLNNHKMNFVICTRKNISNN